MPHKRNKMPLEKNGLRHGCYGREKENSVRKGGKSKRNFTVSGGGYLSKIEMERRGEIL